MTDQQIGRPLLGKPTPAAAYVRMSTEHQQYSVDNQLDVIRQYAERHHLEIVQIYSDEGKSGLNIEGREALGRLIRDVESGGASYREILVYDVSRWGRFQDADESAHYEYLCKRAGLKIRYCAEQFENDGSPVSTIVKGVKRSMAAEYSRELSSKVFRGAANLVKLGFRQGGAAGFGLRRILIDSAGQVKGELKMGEYKSIQTDRVILTPGPPEEVDAVREIFHLFVDKGKNEREIAALLNDRQLLTDFQRGWKRGSVRQILTNEKYIGNNVYNRRSFKLKIARVHNPPEEWVRKDGAFEPIIDDQKFFTAQGILLARSRRLSDEEMLAKLKDIYLQHGRLSGILIDESENLPSAAAYRHRFGSLLRAYRLIGYAPAIDYGFLEVNRRLRELHPATVAEVVSQLEEHGAEVEKDEPSDLLLINRELLVSLALARCRATGAGSLRWLLRFEEGLKPDITIAVRMEP
ncbi:MAG TPA: recombinase family protein, partial [bacterium]|nr:recombinase family protein [bacterium]